MLWSRLCRVAVWGRDFLRPLYQRTVPMPCRCTLQNLQRLKALSTTEALASGRLGRRGRGRLRRKRAEGSFGFKVPGSARLRATREAAPWARPVSSSGHALRQKPSLSLCQRLPGPGPAQVAEATSARRTHTRHRRRSYHMWLSYAVWRLSLTKEKRLGAISGTGLDGAAEAEASCKNALRALRSEHI